MLPVAQKNGASEAVVPSVKIEGERKEKGPHESGNESGQATHTRTLHSMSAENQVIITVLCLTFLLSPFFFPRL